LERAEPARDWQGKNHLSRRIVCHTTQQQQMQPTSVIMSISSASVGFCPSDRITVPSSLVVMVPENDKDKRERSCERKKGVR
jgi:hypothetical protein